MKKAWLMILITLFAAASGFSQCPIVKVSDIMAPPGAVSVPVEMLNFNQDVNSFEFHITFNDTLLNFISVENIAPAFTAGSLVSNITGNTINITWFAAGTGFIPNGQVFDLKFNYIGGFCSDLALAGSVSATNVSWMPGSVCESTPEGIVSLGTQTAPSNSTVTIPLHFSGSGFNDVTAFHLNLSYDPAKLIYIGLANPVAGISVTNSAGNLSLTYTSFIGPQNWTGTDIAGIKFNYAGVSSTDVCFKPGSYVADVFAVKIPTGFTCGQVDPAASNSTLELGEITAFPGQAVTVPVTANNVGSVQGIEMHVRYDMTKLTYTGFTAQQLTNWIAGPNTGPELTFTWLGFGPPATISDGNLLSLNFIYNGCGCTQTEFVAGSVVTSPNLTQLNANWLPGSICPAPSSRQAIIGTVTQCESGVCVPVTFSNVDQMNAFHFNIGFDQDKLDFTGLENVNPLLTGLSVSSAGSDPVIISWMSAAPVNANGVVFCMKFNVHGDSPVTFNCGSSIENAVPQTLPVQYVDGMVDCNLDPVLCVGRISADQTICAGTLPAMLAGVAPFNGSAPTYQWQNSLDNSVFISIDGATALNYQPGALTATTYYRLMQDATGTSGGPLPTNVATITVHPTVVPGTLSAPQTICTGTAPAPVCGSAPLNGTDPIYVWQRSLTGISTDFQDINEATGICYQPGPLTATTYYRQLQQAGGTCGELPTNVVAITVSPYPVPAIEGPPSVCLGAGSVYTTQAGGSGYVWTITGGTINSGQGTDAINVTWDAVGLQGLTVTFTNAAGCSAIAPGTLNITVNANPVPTIEGPVSVCIGTASNYTTQAGGTGYVWTITGGTINSGHGTEAINVTWDAVGTQMLTVTFINAAGCSAIAPGTMDVIVNPNPVPIIEGPDFVCSGADLSYTTQAGGSGYLWAITGGAINSGQGTNAIHVTWDAVGMQILTVTFVNAFGCQAVAPGIMNVSVNPSPVPTIAGPLSACIGADSIYTTQEGGSDYLWTVTGGTINSGQGTNAINVTWNAAGTQNITITYTNASGCSAVAPGEMNVNVHPLPAPTIGFTDILCKGSTAVFNTDPGMTGYTWTVSAGGAIVTGQGTATATVRWDAGGDQQVTVGYTDPSTTCTGTTDLPVFVNSLPGAAGIITGPAGVYLCSGASEIVYSVAPVTGATSYLWSPSPGSNIISGQGTTSITVTFNTNAGNGDFTVSGRNSCGDGVSSVLAVTTLSMPAPVAVALEHVLSATPVIDGAIYTWYYEGNPAVPVGTGNPFTVLNNTGYYWCTVTANGCTSSPSNRVRLLFVGTPEWPASSAFDIYPVPNNGQFTASIRYPVDDAFSVVVYDLPGNKIFELQELKIVGGKAEIHLDLRPIAGGMYYVVFMNSECKMIKKMVIEKYSAQ